MLDVIDHHRKSCQFLIEIIVEFARNAAAFFFLSGHQFPSQFTTPLFAISERLLGLLFLSDVGIGTHPLANASIIPENWHSTALEGPVGSITCSHAEFVLIPRSLLLRFLPGRDATRTIFRVNRIEPSEPFDFIKALPGHLLPRGSNKECLTALVGSPDILRAGGDQCPITFLAFVEGLMSPPVLDCNAGNVCSGLHQSLFFWTRTSRNTIVHGERAGHFRAGR